jgi:hypothetical protein
VSGSFEPVKGLAPSSKAARSKAARVPFLVLLATGLLVVLIFTYTDLIPPALACLCCGWIYCGCVTAKASL